MIHIQVEQGTPEWEKLRLGIPTVSSFDRILTPKKLEPSTKADEYMNQLLAEWFLGTTIDWGDAGQFAERGKHMEAEARAFYEFADEVDVTPGGFVLRDDRKVGGSPDGLVGDQGIVELKCPAIHTHIGYMRAPAALATKYHSQLQGYLYLTDRTWCDIQSYNPILPRVVVRVVRDAKYILALDRALNTFIEYLDAAKAELAAHKRPELAIA